VPVLPGAEPFVSDPGDGSREIGVVLSHGLTGTPQSMRAWGEFLASEGVGVRGPRLAGHGTRWQDLNRTRWTDWYGEVERAVDDLRREYRSVFVFGQSMGGTLTLWLAAQHPETAGIVLVTPACPPPGSSDELLAGLDAMIEAGETLMDGIGSDIADPDGHELAYGQTPIAPLVSLFRNAEEVAKGIGDIACPALLLTSPQDHVVAPEHGDYVAANYGGELERVSLERSFHVATLDHDKDRIEERAGEFVKGIVAG